MAAVKFLLPRCSPTTPSTTSSAASLCPTSSMPSSSATAGAARCCLLLRSPPLPVHAVVTRSHLVAVFAPTTTSASRRGLILAGDCEEPVRRRSASFSAGAVALPRPSPHRTIGREEGERGEADKWDPHRFLPSVAILACHAGKSGK